MALQVLTTSPSALTGRLEQLWRKFVTEEKQQAELPASELVIGNLSVHRVRYVEQNADAASDTDDDNEAASTSPAGLFANEFDRLAAVMRGRSRRTEVSSVVVTWEDVDARWNEPVDATSPAKAEETKDSERRVVYELQHWVAGWGLDAFWHASNRKFTTPDPFVVLADLPTEHDVSFRVRVRVKQTRGFLSGMMFATETDGPWSETVTLSASRDDALQAIVVFLSSNRMFFLVLAICIGLGSLVVLRLLVAQRFVQSSGPNLHAPIATSPISPKKKVRLSHGSSSGADPEQEIADLRQELADSEAEIRKLMIYRGYGLEQLTTNELSHVARELSETLKRVQRLQQPQSKVTGKKSLFESAPVADPFDEDHF